MDTLEYVHKYSNINISRILRNVRYERNQPNFGAI